MCAAQGRAYKKQKALPKQTNTNQQIINMGIISVCVCAAKCNQVLKKLGQRMRKTCVIKVLIASEHQLNACSCVCV